MIRSHRYLLAAAVATFLCVGGGAQALSLSIDPALQTVGPGSEATVAVRVRDVSPEGLGAYDFDVTFDAGILAFDRAVDGLGLGFAIGLGATAGVGSVHVSDFSLEDVTDLLALQGGDFILFSLVFDTLVAGTSAVDFDRVTLGDAAAHAVTADSLTAGRVTVEARTVPEPSAALLMLWALLLCAAPGWRSRV